MDPATQAFLLTYGIPLLTALAGIAAKHYFPTLGSSLLPGTPAAPAAPATPTAPIAVPVAPVVPATAPISTGHPVLDLLRNLFHNATPATAPAILAAVPAILASQPLVGNSPAPSAM